MQLADKKLTNILCWLLVVLFVLCHGAPKPKPSVKHKSSTSAAGKSKPATGLQHKKSASASAKAKPKPPGTNAPEPDGPVDQNSEKSDSTDNVSKDLGAFEKSEERLAPDSAVSDAKDPGQVGKDDRKDVETNAGDKMEASASGSKLQCHPEKISMTEAQQKFKECARFAFKKCFNERGEVIMRCAFCSLMEMLIFGVADLAILGYKLFMNVFPSGFAKCVQQQFQYKISDKTVAVIFQKLTGLPPGELSPSRIFKCIKMEISEELLPYLAKLPFTGEFVRRILGQNFEKPSAMETREIPEDVATDTNTSKQDGSSTEDGSASMVNGTDSGGAIAWLKGAKKTVLGYLWKNFDTRNVVLLATGGITAWISDRLCREFYQRVAATTSKLIEWFGYAKDETAKKLPLLSMFPDFTKMAKLFFSNSTLVSNIVGNVTAALTPTPELPKAANADV